MFYLALSLILLGAFALVAGAVCNRRNQQRLERGEIDTLPTLVQAENMECCGQHETCEKDSLLAAISRQIEYYDDEELDRFRLRRATDYTEEEEDEFRGILYTMKDEEVAGWCRSLQLRGVELPVGLKDEVMLIVGERRQTA